MSKRSEYALRALVRMAEAPPGQVHALGELARGEGISLKFLEQIFLQLRKAGILESRRGAKGGYLLALLPEQVTVRAVLNAIEGPEATVGMGASPAAGSRAARVLGRYTNEVSALVSERHASTTIARLQELEPRSSEALHFEI